MSTKGKIAILVSIATCINVAFIWFVVPVIAAFVRSIMIASQSALAIPTAIEALKSWFANTNWLLGPFGLPHPLGIDALCGWLFILIFNLILVIASIRAQKAPAQNEILSQLPKPVEGNIHGDASFLRTRADFKQFANFSILTIDEIKKSDTGFIYLGMIDGHICGTDNDEHVLILAPTGSGKTQREILQMIFVLGLSDESICIFDPKGELYGLCASYLKKQGFLINRIDFSDPSAGNHWNPLYRANMAYKKIGALAKDIVKIQNVMGEDPELHLQHQELIEQYNERIQVAEYEISQVISILFPRNREREGNAGFFNDGAEDFLRLALHLTSSWPDIPDEQRTIQTALMLLNEYESAVRLFPESNRNDVFYPLDEMAFQLPLNHPAAQAAKSLESDNSFKYHGDFLRSAIGVLSKFASQHALAAMMSGIDFPVEELCDKKTATFIIAPETKKEFQTFAKFYIDQMYHLLMDRSELHGGMLPRRMNMIAEELGQLPPIDDLAGILSISRSKGLRWVLVLQDFARLNEKYGRDAAQSVINNCVWQVLLQTKDLNTAKHFSESFGSYTTWYEERSSSQKPMAWVKSSYSHSGRTVERKLMTADEILRWKADYGAFVTCLGQRPAIVPAPMMFKTSLSSAMGLGTKEENKKLIAATRAKKTHTNIEAMASWRPEYKGQLKFYSATEAKTKYDKWIKNIAVLARKRRGFEGNDTHGANKNAKPKKESNASPPQKPSRAPQQELLSTPTGKGVDGLPW